MIKKVIIVLSRGILWILLAVCLLFIVGIYSDFFGDYVFLLLFLLPLLISIFFSIIRTRKQVHGTKLLIIALFISERLLQLIPICLLWIFKTYVVNDFACYLAVNADDIQVVSTLDTFNLLYLAVASFISFVGLIYGVTQTLNYIKQNKQSDRHAV